MQLGGAALLLAFILGPPLGPLAALHQNWPGDYGVMAAAMIGMESWSVAPTGMA